MGLPVCVTDDTAAARAKAAETFAVYGHLPSYRAMLDREGAGGPEDVAIVGSAGEVAAQVRRLADIGATDFCGRARPSGGGRAGRTDAAQRDRRVCLNSLSSGWSPSSASTRSIV